MRRGAAGREDERRLFGACGLVAQRALVRASAGVGGIARGDGEVVEQRGISRPSTHGAPVRGEGVRGLPRVLERARIHRLKHRRFRMCGSERLQQRDRVRPFCVEGRERVLEGVPRRDRGARIRRARW